MRNVNKLNNQSSYDDKKYLKVPPSGNKNDMQPEYDDKLLKVLYGKDIDPKSMNFLES